jgi:predicted MPP superfamily phosphohydrolase
MTIKSTKYKFILVLGSVIVVFFTVQNALPKPKTLSLVFAIVLLLDVWIDYWIRKNKPQLPQRTRKIFLWIFYATIVGFILLIVGLWISPLAYWTPFLRVYGYGFILILVAIKMVWSGLFVLQFLTSKISFTTKISSAKRWFQVSVCIAVFMFVMAEYGFFEKFNLKIHRIEVRDNAVPKAFDGYRIVQFSDMHTGSQVWQNYVRELVDSINAQNHDLVVFTGDMVNFYAEELTPFVNLFSQIRTKDGVFVVFGNHDYSSYLRWKTPQDSANDVQKLRDIYHSMDWRILSNEHVWLHRGDDSIALAGVENYSSKKNKRWENIADTRKALKGISSTDFMVMLSHNPQHFSEELQPKFPHVNLTLTGHSHGGQMAIGLGKRHFSISQIALKYWRNFHQFENQYLNVNTGAGFNTLPFRINMPPSISVITLKSETHSHSER